MGDRGTVRVSAPLLLVVWLVAGSGCGDDGSSAGRDADAPTDVGGADAAPTDGGMHPPNDGVCRFARATRYPIYREGGVPQGTCDFGPVAADMPRLFRDGYVTAPNETFYNKTPSFAGACGECYELTGSMGRITVMAADICDIACCDNCRGDVVAFDVEEAHWREIVNQEGGNVSVGWRWVPCPVEGNIKAYFTSGWQGAERFRLVVYNHRVGIESVEVRGTPEGATGGVWTPLVRTQDNDFDWDRDPQVDVGLPITLRAVSTQGQAVEFPLLAAPGSDLRIEALGQFDNLEDTEHGPCGWPGPEPSIFDDRLGGILGLEWRDWGSYELFDGDPDYAHHDNCHGGSSCIRVGRMGAWGANQIGFPNDFPPSMFTALELWARTEGGTYDGLKFYYNGTDASGADARSEMVDVAPVGPEWQLFRFELAPIVASVARMRVVRVTNQSNDPSPAIVLDDIRLVP